MKDRMRGSIGGNAMRNLTDEGVFVDGRGTFKVGELQLHPNEVGSFVKVLGTAINKVARADGESNVRKLLDTFGMREELLERVLGELRETDAEILRRRGTLR